MNWHRPAHPSSLPLRPRPRRRSAISCPGWKRILSFAGKVDPGQVAGPPKIVSYTGYTRCSRSITCGNTRSWMRSWTAPSNRTVHILRTIDEEEYRRRWLDGRKATRWHVATEIVPLLSGTRDECQSVSADASGSTAGTGSQFCGIKSQVFASMPAGSCPACASTSIDPAS
jgi:hypothetical protein